MRRYMKSEGYDPAFVDENMMGPNVLWLTEALCEKLDLRPGMRVLDMGCGKGLSSIFLAKEYGVTVFANDLWIDPTENYMRFREAGVADRVYPIHAEAHALPYAQGFFDAAVSMDSYQYYGTDELYFPQVFSRLVRPGGQLGLVCPGLTREFSGELPKTLAPHWDPEMNSFHTANWWRKLWEKTGLADITFCEDLPDAKEIWYHWANGHLSFTDKVVLDADTEDYLTLFLLAAVKK